MNESPKSLYNPNDEDPEIREILVNTSRQFPPLYKDFSKSFISSSPSNDSSLLAAVCIWAGLALKLLQRSLSSIFFGGIHVLPIVPVLGRNGLAADTDGARPGSTLTAAVREDVVGRGRDSTGCTVLWVNVRRQKIRL